MHTVTKIITKSIFLSSLLSPLALANWALDTDQSSLHFISTKKEHISEMHHFEQLSGQLSKTGKFSLNIPLASVKTGIAIRDERMQEHVFKVDSFPVAALRAQLPSSVMALKVGESQQLTVDAKLSLVNQTQELKVSVQVTKTQAGFVATSIYPVLISAADFGLTQGVETLKKLAGLPSIGLTVPVSFNLVLKQAD